MMFLPPQLLEGSLYWKLASDWIGSAEEPEVPKVDFPASRVNKFAIQKFSVDRDAALRFNSQHMARGSRDRMILPGDYTKLVEIDSETICLDTGKIRQNGIIWMSDTTAERQDHVAVYEACKKLGGNVLIHGLGLGVITNAVCQLPNVGHVEVWDIQQDVIDLVYPHLMSKFEDKLMVVTGDAFEHRPKKSDRWSVVWHDVWPTLGSKHLMPMKKISQRWKNYCSWQECWGREFCRWMAKEERNEDRRGRWR